MTSLTELYTGLDQLKTVRNTAAGQREMLRNEKQSLESQLSELKEYIEVTEKARLFLQKVSEAARHAAKTQIEVIVTKALQYVFGVNYSFKIDIRNLASGRPEADFLVVTKYGNRIVESTPTMAKGGGIIDILAAALKFALLELVDYDGPIWMDEPFKHVSEDYIPAVGRLLTFMGETSNRQIVIITHNPRLAEMCNRTLTVGQRDGKSFIEVRTNA